MPVDTLLAYSLAVIGALLTMLIALVVYVFFSLKGQVRDLAVDMNALTHSHLKMMHKEDCRATAGRVHTRLDEQDAQLHELNERMTRVETTLDLTEHC